jgi:hypothetical protein
LDTAGNIFGDFTPVAWESREWNGKFGDGSNCWRRDGSLKSFVFTLKNPHNIAARRFPLKAEKKHRAINCGARCGPRFSAIAVSDGCNTNTSSSTSLGGSYANDTRLDGDKVLTGSYKFRAKEVEVFEITE